MIKSIDYILSITSFLKANKILQIRRFYDIKRKN